MRTYPVTDHDVDNFIKQNKTVIDKVGPDHAMKHFHHANGLRQRMISTWWGFTLFVILCTFFVILVVLCITSLLTSGMFSRIKIILLAVLIVIVWLFMFY